MIITAKDISGRMIWVRVGQPFILISIMLLSASNVAMVDRLWLVISHVVVFRSRGILNTVTLWAIFFLGQKRCARWAGNSHFFLLRAILRLFSVAPAQKVFILLLKRLLLSWMLISLCKSYLFTCEALLYRACFGLDGLFRMSIAGFFVFYTLLNDYSGRCNDTGSLLINHFNVLLRSFLSLFNSVWWSHLSDGPFRFNCISGKWALLLPFRI